ncbi:ROK family protein [Aggregatibacter actinomycetemcomitans]|uniref:NagC family transcriptional regulator n=3 Tax=Aggregatibacter actinomycetemcomitans TaxID=714 RepID=A0A142G331_AGGAC|nr:ROK family protein [Aggregatibacter actinomycetemcomitans]AFI85894.2 NagC-like transcriptional regulator [Aggregatibacter actinomycetemcomitans D7S-1]ACX82782.1 NagC-like transcriptional regulator [Aggregatibacter actinomycetemcomitans D11S-1]AMQ95061.1 NagC family transcriptional regulator [Aggregatibacter actinomycetemcomitans]ANU82403.1 NagC family transcriptional regulator [Aggregatibacter actinomycetemcomitans]EKX96368.1 hypothetical protein HMPREF9996_01245 [Aggregatibacter actinomyce
MKKEDKTPSRLIQLGKIYRLIEQFEEISRIELSKLSGLAPASITSLSRSLIEKRLIMEKTSRNTDNRGRPAIALCVSPFYWQALCATLMEDRFEIILSELDGVIIEQSVFPLQKDDLECLDKFLVKSVKQFLAETHSLARPITFSVTVGGELDKNGYLIKLGCTKFAHLDLKSLFTPYFNIPILIAEYFKTWLLAESTLGNVINCDDVLFLQLDDEINLSVLSEGELLFSREQDKININHLIVPRLNELQALINHDLPEVERYQVQHQVTHRAIAQFIDALYPNRVFSNNSEKMNFLCEQIQLKDKNALRIIEHITDCLAYILMNLVHIFSARRVMLNSSLLQLKDFLLEQLNRKLKSYLVDNISTVSVIAGKYEWNSPIVAASAIKQGIYDGSLLTSLVKQEENIINF